MAPIVQHRRRVNGATGAPDAASSLEGEIAINFPGLAGSPALPELWAFDGTIFRRLNPPGILPNPRSLTAVSNAPNVEDAFNADGINVLPGDIVAFTHLGSTYLYVGPNGSPVVGSTAAHFARLGAAFVPATITQVREGIVNDVPMTPLGLAAVIPPQSLAAGVTEAQPGHPTNPAEATGVATDAGRIVVLNANGKIPAVLSSITGFTFKAADATVPPAQPDLQPPDAPPGTLITMTKTGPLDPSWGVAGNPVVQAGDMLLMDSNNQYHLIDSVVDMSAYLPLAGGTITPEQGKPALAALMFNLGNSALQLYATVDLAAKTITLGGGPSFIPRTLVLRYAVDGGADVVISQAVAIGDTADAVAAKLASAITGAMTATATGPVLKLVMGTATVLDKLSITGGGNGVKMAIDLGGGGVDNGIIDCGVYQ